ncbi:MAG TPA: DUF4440 domain-containing protein, partial [Pyrinomonadaceae bacterium]|nr:DUF4440 domain-containing protein [Pyrinomonadaceae bacterium]
LVPIADDETTVVSPSAGSKANEPPVYKPRDWQTLPYEPPSYKGAADDAKKSKTWPWVVGLLAVVIIGFVGLGIASALIIPKLVRSGVNRNSNTNVRRTEGTPNLNSNVPTPQPSIQSGNENTNTPTHEGVADVPPADENKVLADLTQLEHEWTAANINADKKALDRILADDYVSLLENGRTQGKADYIATIERDNSIERWDFEDLKVSLKGNRATLTGLIRYQLRKREAAFLFIDKYVWRDGRWQAVSSQIKQIQ